jgi:hypothetical protein
VFKNNDIAEVREITDTELVLNDGRRMRRNAACIDQGLHHLSCKPMPYGRSGGCVAGRRRRKRLVCQPIAGSGLDARLHARQGGVTSIGDVSWRAQLSVGACPSFAKFKAAIQRSLGGAPSGNSSRDWNGTLDLCRRVPPIEQNRKPERHDYATNPYRKPQRRYHFASQNG